MRVFGHIVLERSELAVVALVGGKGRGIIASVALRSELEDRSPDRQGLRSELAVEATDCHFVVFEGRASCPDSPIVDVSSLAEVGVAHSPRGGRLYVGQPIALHVEDVGDELLEYLFVIADVGRLSPAPGLNALQNLVVAGP